METSDKLAKNVYKLKGTDKDTFFSPADEWSLPASSVIKPEEREFVVDPGASMHMLSRKDLNTAELATVKVSNVRRRLLQPTAKCKHKKQRQTTKLLADDGCYSQRRSASKRRSDEQQSFSKMHWPFSHSENSAKITDIPRIGPVVRNHNSSKMADD